MLSIARQKLPLTGGSRDVLYAPFYAQKDDSYTGRGRVAALQPIVAVKQKLNIDISPSFENAAFMPWIFVA